MPFTIVRNDITKVCADAIVNTANPHPVIGGGCDSAIYEAAGEQELLRERRRIGDIAPGQAASTPAFRLNARYIIHTVGPVWMDGRHAERETLASCYTSSLQLADTLHCTSIAFPLISSGVYRFPKDEALQIALSAISAFLLSHDMEVILVVFDRRAFELSGKLSGSIQEYIDDHAVGLQSEAEYRRDYEADPRGQRRRAALPPDEEEGEESARVPLAQRRRAALPSDEEGEKSAPWPSAQRRRGILPSDEESKESAQVPLAQRRLAALPSEEESKESAPPLRRDDADSRQPRPEYEEESVQFEEMDLSVPEAPAVSESSDFSGMSLDDVMASHEETFQEKLLELIDKRGLDDVTVYKRANIDRKLFSKIRCNRNYVPKKKTAVAFAIALKLDMPATKDLLGRAGLALSPSNPFDLIISYFVTKQEYDIYEINAALFDYEQPLLGQ